MMRITTRHAVFAGAALVALATAATSAVSLYRLAEQCAIVGPLAASLPIALDAGAGVGALAWITERDQIRTWGRGIAVGALVASLAANGMQHAITAGMLRPTLFVVLAVGASIPAALWAVVHLAALMVRPAPVPAVEVTASRQRPCRGEMKSPGVAVPTPVVVPAPDTVSAHRGARTDRVAWLQGQPSKPWSERVEAVETKFGVSRSTAKRVVAEATRKAS